MFKIKSLENLLFCVLVSSSAICFAQAVSTARVSGVVVDAAGSTIEGATVTMTQTDTSSERSVTTNSDGSYVLTNLPVGPYKIDISKTGFKTYSQSGIVLQVSTNPVLNATLSTGVSTEYVMVQSGATMVETQAVGVGQVIDQRQIVGLPLNGRQATQLILLAGGANTAPAGDLNTNKNYPTVTLSVGGGLPNGMTYLLDGGTHNDPFNNLNLPLPFPDALQEFKVETSSLAAQYGQHAAATVNTVTKSGTNRIHGSAFEFLRNYAFNARDFFAATRDSLKRNQFGGVIGGPIKKDRLFFFAGFQRTIEHSNPPTVTSFVPTQAMLNGDFTTFASAACQGTQKTLAAPFVNNQISPGAFNQQALNVLKFVPVSSDPCGRLDYGISNNNSEYQGIGRLDYQVSDRHSLYGRYFTGNYENPVTWDNKNVLLANKTGVADRAQTLLLGDVFTFNAKTINSFHATVARTANLRSVVKYFSPSDIGSNVSSPLPGFSGITVAGGFTIGAVAINPGYFNSTLYQLTDEVDLIRGHHSISVGGNFIHSIIYTSNNRPTNGQFTFSGQITGLGYADFLLGDLSSFIQGNRVYDDDRANYVGLYAQDSWKIRPRLTLSYGVRWEPFLPEQNSKAFAENFDMSRFVANQHSTVNPSAPAGLLFPGDPGFPGKSNTFGNSHLFAPRFGLIWDPEGKGRMTIRAGYGIFYDTPQLFFFTRVANNPPWGAQVSLANPPGGFTNPYAGQPGGNPFPGGSFFPLNGVYVTSPLHLKPTYLQQWNLSVERQVGANLLLSATYFGNNTIHMPTATELDPAIFGPGATVANTNSRRLLRQINPTQGQFYSTIAAIDDGGTASYHALLLSAQHRFAKGFSALANWTWSHCISDAETTELASPTYTNPGNRGADRSNCSSDRRQVGNLSLVADSPHLSSGLINRITGNWQLSMILRYETGNYLTVVTGRDNALNGISGQFGPLQRPIQVLPNIYAADPSAQQYLNPAAFVLPAAGTLSPMRPLSVLAPGQTVLDMGLSRYFTIHEAQRVQFKWEVFNVPNHANLPPPQLSMAVGTFGTMQGQGASATGPRIMQLALKYEF